MIATLFSTSPGPPPSQPLVGLVTAFSNLQALTLASPQVGEFLSAVTSLTLQLVPHQASCGITFRRNANQPFTVTASDDLAARVDELQYLHRDGPCLESLRTGKVIHVVDLTRETRWHGYPVHAAEQGVRSSLSLPLAVNQTIVGVLNVYSPQTSAFADDTLRQTFTIFADQASAALTMVLRHLEHRETSAQLEAALRSRTVIDQALGILMAQQRCTAAEAFALLRSHSQNTNRKIRDVAAALITRVSRNSPEPGAPFARPGVR